MIDMARQLKCKIFDQRLMADDLENQVNEFFLEHKDIDVENIFRNETSITIIYKERDNNKF